MYLKYNLSILKYKYKLSIFVLNKYSTQLENDFVSRGNNETRTAGFQISSIRLNM